LAHDPKAVAHRMTELSRRTFLRGTSVALGAAAVGGGWARTASALAAPGDHHEQIVADATMRWRRTPTNWQDGPFLANARLGVQVYRDPTGTVLKFMLSHSYVQDQRGQWEAAIGYSRLPIG